MANKCVLAKSNRAETKSNRAETKSNRAEVKTNRAENDYLCAIKKKSLAIITNFRGTKKFLHAFGLCLHAENRAGSTAG